MGKDVNLRAHGKIKKSYVNSAGFILYAKDFLDAANGYKPSHPSPVPYFLYCVSIELGLKAFLLRKDVPIEKLLDKKAYGHNLENILNEARKLSLSKFATITAGQEKEIIKANKYYYDKKNTGGFEYFDISFMRANEQTLPDLSTLEKIANELVNKL